ncbi:MAG: hypothetical protein M3Y72_08615 [Acidobacteriota bacterium]|nr:hypothetical protein [Acidobacteriota bacterium]
MYVTAKNTFQFFWERTTAGLSLPGNFRSGVSLHSHTMFSEESLEMVPGYIAKVPYLGRAIRRRQANYPTHGGEPFDFRRAFWTPPLSPRQAYRLEEKQIQRRLQLPALISLTDHEDIRAANLLRVMNRFRHAPVSTEWTIPFGSTFFHLGVHNIPPEQARELHWQLTEFTAHPAPPALLASLSQLNSYPGILIVLNHPLWDEQGIGAANHRSALSSFLQAHGGQIHALELNGLRSWNENKAVIALGREAHLPVVSGGDRHGSEPNAILNLSYANSFAGFVDEVRRERTSHLVFMPQYREPLRLRVLQTIVDVVRDYPENMEGRRLWSDRVFYRDPDSASSIPLTALWRDGSPKFIRHAIRTMQLTRWRGVQSALRLALDDRSQIALDSGVPL